VHATLELMLRQQALSWRSAAWSLTLAALAVGCGSSTSRPAPLDATASWNSNAAARDGGDAGGRACDPHCVDVLTWHNDNFRSGQNLKESALTPANVDSTHFGKIFVLPVDGKVEAQPLFVSAVDVLGKGTHDVVFVATEHDSLYAFDAESNAAANSSPLWQVTLLSPGETPSDDRNCDQVTPEIGVTSTPVIDVATSTLYVAAMSKRASSYFQRLHAIDIASGAEKRGSPVEIRATYPVTSGGDAAGNLVFDPALYKERAALLLLNGAVYLSWASHCDLGAYNGWIMAYDAATLQQKAVLNLTPQGDNGAIWASGAGPAADGNGNIYFLDANGTFDTNLDPTGFPAQKDFGNAMLRLSTTGALLVSDYFATWNTVSQSAADSDLGSGGAMLLPDEVGSPAHPHLVVGAGKDGNIYLVDRDNMGKWNGADGATNNGQIVQEVTARLSGVFAAPAYFGHAIFYGSASEGLQRFAINAGYIDTGPAASTLAFGSRGTTPSISADADAPDAGTTAIVWAADYRSPAVLHAADLRELYSTAQAGARDTLSSGNKFAVPTIAHGHVYLGTVDSVAVLGLLP